MISLGALLRSEQPLSDEWVNRRGWFDRYFIAALIVTALTFARPVIALRPWISIESTRSTLFLQWAIGLGILALFLSAVAVFRARIWLLTQTIRSSSLQECLLELPSNLVSRQLCVDVVQPLEVAPGLTPSGMLRKLPSEAFDFLRDDNRRQGEAKPEAPKEGQVRLDALPVGRGLGGLFDVLYAIGVYLFTLLARALFRASATLLAPIALLAINGKITAEEGRRRIFEKYDSKDGFVAIALAGLTLACFCVKLLIYARWEALRQWWEQQPWCQVLDLHIAPKEIPLWQLVSVFNAALVFVLFRKISSLFTAIHREGHSPQQYTGALRWIVIGFRIRLVLTAYTFVCIVLILVPWFRSFPPVNWSFFPK
mgnify:CR=1 FL=1